jgi:predicted ATPase
MVVPFFLTLLAEAHAGHGDCASALERLQDARSSALQGGETFALPEIDRLEAEVRWQQAIEGPGEPDPAAIEAVERLYRQSLACAQEHDNRVFALRTTTSLARLLAWRGDQAGARALLAPSIAAAVAQGETPDVVEARARLAALDAAVPGVG